MIVLGGVCPGEREVLFYFFFVVDLVVRMTLHREGGERGKKGTVAA